MSTMRSRSWDAKSCLIIHLMPIKSCQCLMNSYYNQQEPLDKIPLNHDQSKFAKVEKPKKKPKKTSPKFEICGSAFGLNVGKM